MLNVYARTQAKVAGERVDMVIWHSGYFPWNHGKFICKGEGKWSCSGLRSYRSYESEAVGVALRASSTATPSLQTHTFGGKPVHDFLLPFIAVR